jgi:hypothetical protein
VCTLVEVACLEGFTLLTTCANYRICSIIYMFQCEGVLCENHLQQTIKEKERRKMRVRKETDACCVCFTQNRPQTNKQVLLKIKLDSKDRVLALRQASPSQCPKRPCKAMSFHSLVKLPIPTLSAKNHKIKMPHLADCLVCYCIVDNILLLVCTLLFSIRCPLNSTLHK